MLLQLLRRTAVFAASLAVASVVVFALASTLVVWGVGLLVGLLLFPHGEVTLLSGVTVSFANAFGRALLVALYVSAMLAGVGAIGIFASTLTEVPMGAMAATAVLSCPPPWVAVLTKRPAYLPQKPPVCHCLPVLSQKALHWAGKLP